MKNIRRGLAAFGCAALLAGWGGTALAEEAAAVITDTSDGATAAELLAENEEEWVPTAAAPAEPGALKVGGKGAVLMDLSSGKILFEQNARNRVPIASVTKVMTLLLVMEALDAGQITLEEPVTCSAEAASMGGSQIWLEPGETMSVHELIKAAAVVSANDACAALAEHISGSIESFVALMNQRAAELGMTDTRFLDCSGLSDDAYSCAGDVAQMSRELMKHEAIRNYTTIWMDTLRGGKSQLVNTNKLVRHYNGATGLKTGTTQKAGHCLAATAERDGFGLVAVILGCATTDERFGGARKMLDYGFANYSIFTPTVDPSLLAPVPVLRGVEEQVEVELEPVQSLLVKKGEEKAVELTVDLAADLEAPVLKGQVVGEVALKLHGEKAASYAVCAAREIPRVNFGLALQWLLRALCT